MLQILCRGKQAGQTQLHFCGCVYSPACLCAIYSLYILILVAHRMQYVLLVVFLLVRKGKNNTVMPVPSHHPDKLRTLVTWCPCTARGGSVHRGRTKCCLAAHPRRLFFWARLWNVEGKLRRIHWTIWKSQKWIKRANSSHTIAVFKSQRSISSFRCEQGIPTGFVHVWRKIWPSSSPNQASYARDLFSIWDTESHAIILFSINKL